LTYFTIKGIIHLHNIQKGKRLTIEFKNKQLLTLYKKGKSKKYTLNKAVLNNFFSVVVILESAKDIYDLWNLPSLNFEKMQGFKSRYSVRLNKKYRLEMTIEWTNEELTIGIIGLEDISNHYGGR